MPVNQPTVIFRIEQKSSHYFHMVPPGIALAEVMASDFWVHVRQNFRVNDVIDAVAADGAFDVSLRVVSLNHASGIIKFRTLRMIAAPEGAAVVMPDAAERYEVRHVGHGQFKIIERATGKLVADGMTKADAVTEKDRLELERVAA